MNKKIKITAVRKTRRKKVYCVFIKYRLFIKKKGNKRRKVGILGVEPMSFGVMTKKTTARRYLRWVSKIYFLNSALHLAHFARALQQFQIYPCAS